MDVIMYYLGRGAGCVVVKFLLIACINVCMYVHVYLCSYVCVCCKHGQIMYYVCVNPDLSASACG